MQVVASGQTVPVISHPNPIPMNTSEHLVELLQQSAVEHLTVFRQLEVQEFSSVSGFVRRDFEALYAYKCGDYQRCFQLSKHNLHMLVESREKSYVLALPEIIQLMDDEILSLIGLTLIAIPSLRDIPCRIFIYLLPLSLYLMTQCQMKICHSVTSLAKTLDCVEVARRPPHEEWALDQLLLKLTQRKIQLYISGELV